MVELVELLVRLYYLNKISNLCVIDFDINKSYNDELKESIRKQLISQLSDEDVVVRTGSGGFACLLQY